MDAGGSSLALLFMGMDMLRRLVHLILGALACSMIGGGYLFAFCSAWAWVPTKKVLILFPYENNFPGFFYFDNAFRSSLNASPSFQFDYYVETMDLLRFPEKLYFEELVHVYRQKYAKRHIDLIIALLGPARDFLAKYQDELFPGTPVLFMDIDTRLLDGNAGTAKGPAVTGRLDVAGTLEIALGLHPDVRHVFAISGSSPVDRGLEALARTDFERFADRFQVHYLCGLTMNDLLEKVAELPKDSIIVYLTFYQDADGKAFLPPQALSMISQSATVPIYGLAEPFIGRGMVGGRVYSFTGIGDATARSALRILSGEDPGGIESVEVKADQAMFDWNQLRRWSIGEASLPHGSIIRNREFSVWKAYWLQILGILSILILQTFLITALISGLIKRRQANRKLKESEVRLFRAAEEWKTTFNSIPDLVMVLDPDLRILRANEATAQFFGVPLDQLLGSTCYMSSCGAEKPFERRLLDLTLETKRHAEEEVFHEERNAWFLVSVVPILNDNNEITGFLHSARDVTERKRAEAEAHRQMTELAHVTRVSTMGELAASLAHEINQPLTAILSNAQAALRFLCTSEQDVEEVRQILGDIVRDDKRVSEVIRRMRALLKQQAGSWESFHLSEALMECVALVNSASLLDGLSISTRIATDGLLVHADRVQLQQVLFNLLVNAVGAMRSAPRTSRNILLSAVAEDGHRVKISVTDSGTGIDERHVDQIFEPFYTTKPDGMGMGLSISQTIIKAHGGRIWAVNNAEGGATFSFTLPIESGRRHDDDEPDGLCGG